MTNWINEQLEQPLKDIADLQAAINTLEANSATGDELVAAVAKQKAALDQARVTSPLLI